MVIVLHYLPPIINLNKQNKIIVNDDMDGYLTFITRKYKNIYNNKMTSFFN